MTISKAVEDQARYLAAENHAADPAITSVLWFPDDQEIRMVSVSAEVPTNGDEDLHPFFFRASPADLLPFPSSVAMIRPEELGKLKLPADWGTWADAVKLWEK